MKVQLTQRDIEVAMAAYVADMGLNGTIDSMNFTRTRQGKGGESEFLVDIEIFRNGVDAQVATARKAADILAQSADEKDEPEEEAPVVEAEPEAPVAEEPKPEPKPAPKAAKKPVSQFAKKKAAAEKAAAEQEQAEEEQAESEEQEEALASDPQENFSEEEEAPFTPSAEDEAAKEAQTVAEEAAQDAESEEEEPLVEKPAAKTGGAASLFKKKAK